MEEYVVGGLGALAHKVVQTRAAEVLNLVPAMSHACMRACILSVARCRLWYVARSCMLYAVRSTWRVARCRSHVPRWMFHGVRSNVACCMSPLRSATWWHVRCPMNKARWTSDVVVPRLEWICCIVSAECCILLRGKYGMLHVAFLLARTAS